MKFTDEPLKEYMIAVMNEAFKLKVDESGAKVEGRAILYATKSVCVKKKEEIPREFILDKSFWLVMKEVKKHPYACVLVNNPVDISELE